MKIEIPEYGPVELKHLKVDVAKSNMSSKDWSPTYTGHLVHGLINKIEELQSDIDALEFETGRRKL